MKQNKRCHSHYFNADASVGGGGMNPKRAEKKVSKKIFKAC